MKLPENTGGSFENCPAGNHLAVCFSIIDLGTQTSVYDNEEKKQRKIQIGWELAHEKMSDGRPFVITKRYTLSSHEKSTLMHDLNSWRGVAFTEEDFGRFEINVLLGKACYLSCIHKPSLDGSKTYCNVASIAALPKGVETPELVNEPITFDLAEPSQTEWAKLPEWTQDAIRKSPEFKALDNEQVQEDPNAELAQVAVDDSGIPF